MSNQCVGDIKLQNDKVCVYYLVAVQIGPFLQDDMYSYVVTIHAVCRLCIEVVTHVVCYLCTTTHV